MAEPSTLAEAETYTRQVADLLKAAGRPVTDYWADTDEDGYCGHIELDDAQEGYAWDPRSGWFHLAGKGLKGVYDNVTPLGFSEGTVAEDVVSAIAKGVVNEEPVYYECNSCGEEFDDDTGVCCDDGEIVPHNDI